MVLPFSNSEWARVCRSGSFLSLKIGLQSAAWELGGVPLICQSDNSSTATHDLGRGRPRRGYNARYLSLLDSYGMRPALDRSGRSPPERGCRECAQPSGGCHRPRVDARREPGFPPHVEDYEKLRCGGRARTQWGAGRAPGARAPGPAKTACGANSNAKPCSRKLDGYRVIILDDLGYLQQTRQEIEVLFIFFAERYERRSLMIGFHLVFSQWERIFQDPMTAMASVDRLVTTASFWSSTARAHAQKPKARKTHRLMRPASIPTAPANWTSARACYPESNRWRSKFIKTGSRRTITWNTEMFKNKENKLQQTGGRQN